MVDIQRRVDEKNGRNVLSRAFDSYGDKVTITAWKEDFDEMLHIFNVRSVCSIRHSLTAPFQTELAIDTNVIVTGTHQEVADIHEEVTNMHREVTDMHQDVLAIKEGVLDEQCLVCCTSLHQRKNANHLSEAS